MGGKPRAKVMGRLDELGIVVHSSIRRKSPGEMVGLALRVKDLRDLANGECNVHTAGLAVQRMHALGISLHTSFLDKIEDPDRESGS